ncbi:MAG: hypothetical protein JWM11_5415, partial [Planctomycetaceae bacterium]|nr:hypothetical protein [Planctomycetaceae bacterium]
PITQFRVLIVVMASYLLFYLGLTAFLGRSLRRLGTDLHAAHARVLGVLLVAFGSIAPMLFMLIIDAPFDNPWLMLSSPFFTLNYFINYTQSAPVLNLLNLAVPCPLLLGLVGVMLNLTSISRGIREFFSLPPRAPFVEELE